MHAGRNVGRCRHIRVAVLVPVFAWLAWFTRLEILPIALALIVITRATATTTHAATTATASAATAAPASAAACATAIILIVGALLLRRLTIVVFGIADIVFGAFARIYTGIVVGGFMMWLVR